MGDFGTCRSGAPCVRSQCHRWAGGGDTVTEPTPTIDRVNVRQVLSWVMLIEVVGCLIFAPLVLLRGNPLLALVLLGAAAGIGWITHPVRYAIDKNYRSTTTRLWWQ